MFCFAYFISFFLTCFSLFAYVYSSFFFAYYQNDNMQIQIYWIALWLNLLPVSWSMQR